MSRRMQCATLLACLVLVTAVVAVLTACGSSTTTPAEEATPSGGDTASLPSSIVESGVLKVGTNMPYPPFQFYESDGSTPTGAEVDLVEEIAARLGLRVEWNNMNYDGLIPALQSKRFDMVAAAVADYLERQEIVDMVDFFESGSSAVVLAENAPSFSTAEDLGGKTVGVLKNSIAAAHLKKLSSDLETRGLQPIDLKFFPDDNAGLAAMKSGRVLAHVADTPTSGYIVKTSGGTYAMVLPDLLGDPLPFGFPVRKEDAGLSAALRDTLNEMIADGTYQQILESYGIVEGALDESTINGGTTSSEG